MTVSVALGPSASLAYETRGAGVPLIALHGAYSRRVEMREFLEPMIGGRSVRRIYADLPGHGESRPSEGVDTPDAVLDVLDRLIDAEVPDGPFLLLGHSFGAHMARAFAARHPSRVAGLALICPAVAGEPDLPAPRVVRDDGVGSELDDAQREEFHGYFVVRTAATLVRFRAAVVPAMGDVDEQTLARAIDTGPHAADPDAVTLAAPVLVLSGREDRWVGWRAQEKLGGRYPRATVVTVADAGHALPHERPALVDALVNDWLDRCAAERG
jgi:pimeloyl-ACP methyl ester carboxylesterase